MTLKIDNIIDTVAHDKKETEKKEAMLFGREALSPLMFNNKSMRTMQSAEQM